MQKGGSDGKLPGAIKLERFCLAKVLRVAGRKRECSWLGKEKEMCCVK